jgi:membrane-associated phospholipid phosphatase
VSGEDLTLVRDLVRQRTSTLTTLAHAASWLGRSYVLVPAAVLVAAVAAALGRRRVALPVIVAVVGSVIVQNVAKAIIDRPRPPVVALERVSGTSFPSGHATEATAFFGLLLLVALSSSRSAPVKLAAVLATGAIVGSVALSRVYLGVHYPSDVLAGIVLGGAWSLITGVILLTPRRAVPPARPAS